MNLLNRQLLSDSLELLLPQSALIFGRERENYENPRIEIIANGHFQHLSSIYRDTQIWKYFYHKNVRSLVVSVRLAWNFLDAYVSAGWVCERIGNSWELLWKNLFLCSKQSFRKLSVKQFIAIKLKLKPATFLNLKPFTSTFQARLGGILNNCSWHFRIPRTPIFHN